MFKKNVTHFKCQQKKKLIFVVRKSRIDLTFKKKKVQRPKSNSLLMPKKATHLGRPFT